MKKIILWGSCVLLFLLIAACNKQNETISLLSMHTWVAKTNSSDVLVGDEFQFLDNRLFFHSRSGERLNDGKWNFSSDYISDGNEIKVESDLGEFYYIIKSVTNTELQLTPINVNASGWNGVYYLPTITLTPK